MDLARYDGPDGPEIVLPQGDVTEAVVRIGRTVRRPAQPQSAAVAGYLHHLEAAGFAEAPRFLGRDRHGRDVLDFLDGEVSGSPPEGWATAEPLLISVGMLLRRLHQASAGCPIVPPAGTAWFTRPLPAGVGPDELPAEPAPELVSHNDLTQQNVVVRDGLAVGVIDFDMAGPTTRLADFFMTAMYWVPLRHPADLWPAWAGLDQPRRLRILADAYRLADPERAVLVDYGIRRCDRMWLLMKGAAEQLGGGWARMWAGGVGDLIRRRQSWLAAERDTLTAALR